MVSTQVKIKRLSGMLGTDDLNPKETQFVENLVERQRRADVMRQVLQLSEAQLDWLEDLFDRHFAA